ncbi:MAG: amidohydrolase family protein [Clostridiales Family XIII bacterium]|jgi:adenine deaminase|nr:amidohydrolase family protein [Clostridiales Family XIII bacterium]
MNTKLLSVAKGETPADIVIKNGRIVNVYTKEIYEGGVSITGDRIAAIGDVGYTIGESTQIIDASGNYITPGFIDGHIHPESTSLSIQSFANLVLKHGTTVIFTDLHEAGVVSGLEAIEALLDEAQETALKHYFVVPSHVPFSPQFETSGGSFNTEIIKGALQREDAVGLSEAVSVYIIAGFPDLLDSIDAAKAAGKSIQGHLPDATGAHFNVVAAAGVSTDHEAISPDEGLLRLRNGLHLMIREGSAARSLETILAPILEQKLDTSRVSIVTDDLHTVDGVFRGHLDDAVRTALKTGAGFADAIQFVSLNAARAFSLENEIGGLAPGKRADVNITTGPEDFKILSVISGGTLVVSDEKLVAPYPVKAHDPKLLNTVHLKRPVTAADFAVKVADSVSKVRVQIMDTLQWIPLTEGRVVELAVKDGVVQSDLEQDVLYIAQVERHGKNGNIGKAFMGGFRIKEGAIASSVGHDNHNIIVLGTNHEDMAVAVNRVATLQGGQVVVNKGAVVSEVAYPILGLLSDLDAASLAAVKQKLNADIHELGSEIPIPFMFLSFISLAAIPSYAVTDKGFIDVLGQKIIDPVLETIG